jgi:hypothetical protein
MSAEIDLEKAVCDYIKSRGFTALKLIDEGRRGFPDRTVFGLGSPLFIEFKSPKGGDLSAGQIKRLKELDKVGRVVVVGKLGVEQCKRLRAIRRFTDLDEFKKYFEALEDEFYTAFLKPNPRS